VVSVVVIVASSGRRAAIVRMIGPRRHEPIRHDWLVDRRATAAAPGPDLVALLDGWAAAGHGPLARRLAHALRHVIDAGVLAPGVRLPPERTLARQLAVGRTTVTQALDELRAEGRLRSMQGSGTYVAGPSQPTPFGTRIAEHLASGAGIDLAKGDAPDLSHLPEVALEMWQLNATCGGAAVNVAGLPAMREAVAELYAKGGTTGRPRSTVADQIHVTAGSHQAAALLVATLARPGAAIAVEACTYAGIFDILDASGVRAVPVPMDRAGIIPESLDEVLGREQPAALYFQAGPQVPTGRVMPAARVRSVAGVLDRHAARVIEDTTVAAVAFDGVSPMLADTCRRATVISTGSLSKLCWSGLRLGWLRAPASVVAESVYRHLTTDLGASVPSQLLALQLLPHLDVIAAERRRRLAAAIDDALELLAASVPEAAVERPDGGSILWVELPVDDAAMFVQLARHHGVRISPGSIHVADKTPGPFVRIDVDRPAPLLREGIERLGRAWRAYATT
jgi:DNA-binding transcriptional MocR family regulator